MANIKSIIRAFNYPVNFVPNPANYQSLRDKLKTARLESRRRKQREYYHDNKEYMDALRMSQHRQKVGIPLDLPKMKAWDFKKGKVKL